MSTLRFVCVNKDCTIAATGKCLELHEPANCPNASAATSAPTLKNAIDPSNRAARKFPPSTELGLKDSLAITHGMYAHVIAILGATDAGKTCLLNALYLLASHGGLLPRFQFAGSLTLAGFELRTRRLRKWQNGQLPNQLAEHTTHADPRNPGLLHLSLSDRKNGSRRIELLLTDLPGEWTTGLIKQAQKAERFEFLQRADGLVIAVDGSRLRNANNKRSELLNLEILVDRLADAVNLDRRIPIFFVSCKADSTGVDVPSGLDEVVKNAQDKGFVAQAVTIASFSKKPTVVANGYGIQSLVEAIIDYAASNLPIPVVCPEPIRSFGRSIRTT